MYATKNHNVVLLEREGELCSMSKVLQRMEGDLGSMVKLSLCSLLRLSLAVAAFVWTHRTWKLQELATDGVKPSVDKMLNSHATLTRQLGACFRGSDQCILLQKKQPEPYCDGRTVVAMLKDCSRSKDLRRGTDLHTEIAKTNLLESDPFVGNSLIDMYAKCGSIGKAREVFDEMEKKDTVSWNVLIGGYVNYQCGEEALACFERMTVEGTLPDAVTYVCGFKACGSLMVISKGKEIHATVQERGLLKENIFVGNALIDMYAKHGLVTEAHKVFDELSVRDVVSWNTLISGHVKHDGSREALTLYKKMKGDGVHPTAVTYCCVLKACAAIGAAEEGSDIHARIMQERVLESSPEIGELLITMFIKCGLIVHAQDVFSKLSTRSMVSWTALIAGCVECADAEQSLGYAEKMRLEAFLGNPLTFVYGLKACGVSGALDKGKQIHTEIIEIGLLVKETVVGNALVDMYVKCGLLTEAHKVLENHWVRDVVSWTSLMAGYVNYERDYEALNCFERMQHDGVSPNEVSFALSLKACGSVGAIDKGLEIHAELARRCSWKEKLVVGNALVDMYVKCGSLAKACEVFEQLPVHDVISWTTIIAGYTSHGCGEQALACFEQMKYEGIFRNSITDVCGLQACEIAGALNKGREIHAEITKRGAMERDIAVGNALINIYAKFRLFGQAWIVLYNLLVRDVVSWTALIAGYAYHQKSREAITCFELMRLEMVPPNPVTLVCVLKACGNIEAIDKGMEIHAQLLKLGMTGRESFVGSALIDMYCNCGYLKKAQELFDDLIMKDVVSWNALMSGYVEHNHAREALTCFEHMQLSGVSPDAVSFICSLKACETLGAVQKGSFLHAEIARRGLLERDSIAGNALVDMYAKCGFLAKAQEVFSRLFVRDPVSWTSLITAYAQLGLNKAVLSVFRSMEQEDVKPDFITFMSVLKTCSQTCLVDEGQTFFEAISEDFGLAPTLEHHTCMVDLLGQAGHLDKAVALIQQMPFNPDLGVWHTLLDACQNLGNVNLGRRAFVNAMQVDDKDGVAFVRMTSIYADAWMQEERDRGTKRKLLVLKKGHSYCWGS